MLGVEKERGALPLTGDEAVEAEEKQWTVIDRSLNYGRHQIKRFLLSAGPYRTVIDLGAGQGDDLMLARSINIQADIHAVEVYPVYAARLAEKGIRVHNLNIEKDRLPFQEGAVDVVIANQVLEHVKELFWIFHEITRVLPIGGKMILGVPNLASLHNRILLAFGRQPSPLKNNSAHIRGYTKRDLIKFLDSCFPGGYKLREFGGSNFYPFPPIVARPFAKLLPNMAWGIFFMFEKQRSYKNEFLEFPVKERLETNFYVGK
jgi:SAM-dependent methyltransferase